MSKYKTKGNGGTPEVHSARSKLDGVLQTLVDKKEDSPTQEANLTLGTIEPILTREEVIPTTPTKKQLGSGKSSRKRRKGKDDLLGMEVGQYHHTYVMKLFDRSVDLAQFADDAPLYPICRAWMRNQPHNRNLAPRDRSPTPEPMPSTSFDEDDEEDLLEREIFQLPSPLPLPKVEPDLNYADPRIPQPVVQPDDKLDIHAEAATAPPPEQLLLNHMARWKKVRHSWKIQARLNERRYESSLRILKDMFDKQCKDQP